MIYMAHVDSYFIFIYIYIYILYIYLVFRACGRKCDTEREEEKKRKKIITKRKCGTEEKYSSTKVTSI